MKKEKEICASFNDAPQTVKATAMVCGKCLVKMKKALYICIYVERARYLKEKPHSHIFYYRILL